MGLLGVGYYALSGKVIGKLPYPKGAEAARRAAEEGIVLLKNDGALPLTTRTVALFGCGAADTCVCGTGSGYAFAPYTVSVYDGLKNAGFTVTSNLWMKNYEQYKKKMEKERPKLSFLDKRFSGITKGFDAPLLTADELADAKSADTAVYVVKRNTGEGFDRRPEKGDYYLSDNELKNIGLLKETFRQVVVILNTCVVDASELEASGVNAVVFLGQAGMEAGNALADILTGKVNPSGKLTDTWAKTYADYPASANFSQNDGNTLQADYLEDIYVGYRHFDTKGLDVVYPFGYGLSYTTFAFENVRTEADWETVRVTLDVRNTGLTPGREVVQVYAGAPSGSMGKPYQELKGYKKTGLIAPGKSGEVTVTFRTADLASYSEEKEAWVMEKGRYVLYLGNHSRNTQPVCAIGLDEDAVTVQLSRQVPLDRELAFTQYPVCGHPYEGQVLTLSAADCKTVDGASKVSRELTAYVTEERGTKESAYRFAVETTEKTELVRSMRNATLLDVVDGKITMEEFVASLDDEILARLVAGNSMETPCAVEPRLPKGSFKSKCNPYTSGKTTDMFSQTLGIPAMSLCDGPAGLHIMGSPGCAYPVGMVLAQTWDPELVEEIGNCYGAEMEVNHCAIALAPGMNIHRDPLCGRNFEYYSEDPLVTGKSAAAFTRGLQENHPGYGVAVKHFCCNNQEIDRNRSNSSVSERALREIYLKGFEIAVKEAQPLTVMSSYNLLNGVHTSSRYDLITDVLRGEWGFKGFVMTDWDGTSDRIADLQAGNDILMGGYQSDPIVAAMNDVRPEFNDDGTVKQQEIKAYGGAFKRKIDRFGSFMPDKNGTDTITVHAEKKVNEKALKPLVDEGVVTVSGNDVIYRGFGRAHSLKLSCVQRNVIRILNYTAFGAPMKMAERK